MTAKEYQNSLFQSCRTKFTQLDLKNEWAAFSGEFHQYSPRVDIAVGPFNIAPGPNLGAEYDRLIRTRLINGFVRRAFDFHRQNVNLQQYGNIEHPTLNDLLNMNFNARCLLAIEIENTNSKKHMMGSIINAASLGRVGIGIAYCDSALRTFLRIVNYLAFLRKVGKNTYNTNNFLILSVDQFNQLVDHQNNPEKANHG